MGLPLNNRSLSITTQPDSLSRSESLKKKSSGQTVTKGLTSTLVSRFPDPSAEVVPDTESIPIPCGDAFTILPLPWCFFIYPSFTSSLRACLTVGRVIWYVAHSSFSEGKRSPSVYTPSTMCFRSISYNLLYCGSFAIIYGTTCNYKLEFVYLH